MNKWKESKAPLYYPEKPGERVFMKENKQIKTISCFLKRQEKKYKFYLGRFYFISKIQFIESKLSMDI